MFFSESLNVVTVRERLKVIPSTSNNRLTVPKLELITYPDGRATTKLIKGLHHGSDVVAWKSMGDNSGRLLVLPVHVLYSFIGVIHQDIFYRLENMHTTDRLLLKRYRQLCQILLGIFINSFPNNIFWTGPN